MSDDKKLLTPIGEVKFPELDGSSKGDDGKTKYSVMMTFDPKDAKVKEMMKTLDAEFAMVKDGNVKPYKEDFKKDPDTGEKVPTGRIAVTMTSQYPVKFFDASRSEISANIGWGTRAKAACKMDSFDFRGKRGVSKFLLALQIIELKESGYTADSLGFDEEEGYTAGEREQIPF